MLSDIAEGLSSEGYNPAQYDSRGERLEVLLTTICHSLGEVGDITENKADIEFILGVVGAYLISKKRGTLPEDNQPPSFIFDNNLFPILDESTVVVEDIPEDGD